MKENLSQLSNNYLRNQYIRDQEETNSQYLREVPDSSFQANISFHQQLFLLCISCIKSTLPQVQPLPRE